MVESVALLGASGFVGSTVLEHLERDDRYAVTPFAGSTGGASALAHQGRILTQIDMLDAKALTSAIAGFDTVVNCARGGSAAMQQGFDNLVAAAKSGRVKKLVHISSVAVYGDPPHADSVSEDAATTAAQSGYGAAKRDQDEKLQKAARNGLGAVILCPPNIIGPYSDYLLDIIESIERGRFRLIEAGQTAINVIDVHALAAAVERALASSIDDGRRLFVAHPENTSWRDLCDALAPILRTADAIPAIDAAAVEKDATAEASNNNKPRSSAIRHLISEDVREALKTHPTWATVESAGKRAVRAFGGRAENTMRHVANGPIQVDRQTLPETFDRALVAQQLRRVKHRPDKLVADLDFTFPLNFTESMQRFNAWYTRYLDAKSNAWRLLANRAD